MRSCRRALRAGVLLVLEHCSVVYLAGRKVGVGTTVVLVHEKKFSRQRPGTNPSNLRQQSADK